MVGDPPYGMGTSSLVTVEPVKPRMKPSPWQPKPLPARLPPGPGCERKKVVLEGSGGTAASEPEPGQGDWDLGQSGSADGGQAPLWGKGAFI